MIDWVVAFLVTTSQALFALFTWDLAVSWAGLLPMAAPPETPNDRQRRFAILVPAHNEARVLEGVLESLKKQDYPAENLHVFVIADNCTDDTAAVGRAAGVQVIERFDDVRRTKGYAMQYGIHRIIQLGPFDGFCVFDADNVVPPNFFAMMSRYLGAGHVAVQTYLDTSNPLDTWVTRCIALAYFVTNRFWMRGRTRIGLAATLGGTGFCVAWNVLLNYRWDPGSLSDDLELTINLIVHDVQVSYCPHTRTYDEKPQTLRQSMRQRSRWMQGHNDVASRWIPVLLRTALKRPFTRHAVRCIDAALYLLQPLRVLMAFGCMVALFIAYVIAPDAPGLHDFYFLTGWGIGIWVTIFVAYPLFIGLLERAPFGVLIYLLPSILFSFSWIPAIVMGLFRMRQRVWVHTIHGTRAQPLKLRAQAEPAPAKGPK